MSNLFFSISFYSTECKTSEHFLNVIQMRPLSYIYIYIYNRKSLCVIKNEDARGTTSCQSTIFDPLLAASFLKNLAIVVWWTKEKWKGCILIQTQLYRIVCDPSMICVSPQIEVNLFDIKVNLCKTLSGNDWELWCETHHFDPTFCFVHVSKRIVSYGSMLRSWLGFAYIQTGSNVFSSRRPEELLITCISERIAFIVLE